MAARQELQVQKKRELEKTEETTIPARVFRRRGAGTGPETIPVPPSAATLCVAKRVSGFLAQSALA